jgi:hypothetical protein
MTDQFQPRTDAGKYSFKQQGAPTIELGGATPLPELPASVGTPEVGFYYRANTPITHVTVGESTMEFWTDDDGEITNSIESGPTTDGEDAPWGHIPEYADFEQTRTWAEAVHGRIETSISRMDGEAVDGEYGAIIDFATGARPAGEPQSPEVLHAKRTELAAALAAQEHEWDTEESELEDKRRDLDQRRARLAGARAASAVLAELPNAATLAYTRSPVFGSMDFDEVRNADGAVIFGSEDVARPFYADLAVTRRRGIIERAVSGLKDPDRGQLPDPAAQGITAAGTKEELNLAAAIDDGLAVLAAAEPTPEQSAAARATTALSSYDADEDDETRLKDLFTDLRHYADSRGIDLHEVMDASYSNYLHEKNDPAFKEGL